MTESDITLEQWEQVLDMLLTPHQSFRHQIYIYYRSISGYSEIDANLQADFVIRNLPRLKLALLEKGKQL